MSLRTIIIIIFSLAAGAIYGYYYFEGNLAFIPTQVVEEAHELLSMNKRQVIGFMPYWLFAKADKDYQKYISTQTYFGLSLKPDGSIRKLANAQEEDPGWTTLKSSSFTELFSNKKVKKSLLVATADEDDIMELISKPEEHAHTLIEEVTPIMRKYGFTDLNLDIESFNVASDEARANFTTFVKEVKKGTQQNNLGTLTVEASPTVLVKKFLINLSEVGQIADTIVLMAYDYHYIGSELTGPVAPINGKGETREYDVETGIQEAIKVIPKYKIMLGIPLYGYQWETIENQPGLPAIPASGATASNRRIEELLKDCKNCITGVDQYSQQPYLIFPSEDNDYYRQIYYEDTTSMKKKVALAEKYQLGGLALWALGYEGTEILKPLDGYKK